MFCAASAAKNCVIRTRVPAASTGYEASAKTRSGAPDAGAEETGGFGTPPNNTAFASGDSASPFWTMPVTPTILPRHLVIDDGSKSFSAREHCGLLALVGRLRSLRRFPPD